MILFHLVGNLSKSEIQVVAMRILAVHLQVRLPKMKLEYLGQTFPNVIQCNFLITLVTSYLHHNFAITLSLNHRAIPC